MPVIIKPKSPLTAESDSVMEENPVQHFFQKLIGLTGLDDPNNQIQELMNPMSMVAAPLVSLFKNKAAREASTKLFRDKANIIGEDVGTAAGQFADEYPRVAAHIKPSYLPGHEPHAYTQHLRDAGPLGGRVPVNIPRNEGLAAAKDAIYHEGTHAAQALGNKDFDKLYDEATKRLGYNDNPFELSAWDAGLRASGKREPSYPRPENAIKSLEGYAEDLGPTSKLAKILQSRAKKP